MLSYSLCSPLSHTLFLSLCMCTHIYVYICLCVCGGGLSHDPAPPVQPVEHGVIMLHLNLLTDRDTPACLFPCVCTGASCCLCIYNILVSYI